MFSQVQRLEARETPATFTIANGDIAALIGAIDTSNTNNQADTIVLAANGSYTFTGVAPTETITALPTIRRDTNSDANTLTIEGSGSSFVRSGTGGTPEFRFLNIGAFPDNISVTVSNLSFTNGRASTADGGAIALTAGSFSGTNLSFTQNSAARGGAVYTTVTNSTNLGFNLVNCSFANNSATNGAGGGAYLSGTEAVALTDCTFTANTASAEGGGLRLFLNPIGTTTLTRSTFSGNTANGGNGGGGCFAQSNSTIIDSTFDSNTAAQGGGGLFHQGTLIASGSTFSNNSALATTASGGGVFEQGDLTLTNCTIDGNRAGSGGGLAYVNGGNIANISLVTITNNRAFFPIARGGGVRITGADFRLANSVVAGNSFEATATSPAGPDISGAVLSQGYNLIGNAAGATIMGPNPGDQIGSATGVLDPLLAPLAANGGFTRTRHPLPGSPLIDLGDPAFAPPPGTDQCGAARVVGGRLDIGAVEVSPPTVQSVRINDGTVQRSRVTSLTVTFNTTVTFASAPVAAFTLTSVGGRPVNFMATSSVIGGVTVVTLNNLTGLDAEFGSLRDGRYTLTALFDQISANGLALNGGSDYTFGDPQGLYRFYGDMNGDRRVDISDFGLFSLAYFAPPNYIAPLDFNDDGRIDIADFGQFSVRYFTTLP